MPPAASGSGGSIPLTAAALAQLGSFQQEELTRSWAASGDPAKVAVMASSLANDISWAKSCLGERPTAVRDELLQASPLQSSPDRRTRTTTDDLPKLAALDPDAGQGSPRVKPNSPDGVPRLWAAAREAEQKRTVNGAADEAVATPRPVRFCASPDARQEPRSPQWPCSSEATAAKGGGHVDKETVASPDELEAARQANEGPSKGAASSPAASPQKPPGSINVARVIRAFSGGEPPISAVAGSPLVGAAAKRSPTRQSPPATYRSTLAQSPCTPTLPTAQEPAPSRSLPPPAAVLASSPSAPAVMQPSPLSPGATPVKQSPQPPPQSQAASLPNLSLSPGSSAVVSPQKAAVQASLAGFSAMSDEMVPAQDHQHLLAVALQRLVEQVGAVESRQLAFDRRLAEVDGRVQGFADERHAHGVRLSQIGTALGDLAQPAETKVAGGIGGRLAALECGQRAMAQGVRRALRAALSLQQKQQSCAAQLEGLQKGEKGFDFGPDIRRLDHSPSSSMHEAKAAASECLMEEQERRMAELEAAVASLVTDVSKPRLPEVDFEAADKSIKEQELRVRQLESAVASLSSSIAKVTPPHPEADMGAAARCIKKQEQRIGELEVAVSALAAQAATVPAAQREAEQTVARCFKEQERRVAEIEQALSNLAHEVSKPPPPPPCSAPAHLLEDVGAVCRRVAEQEQRMVDLESQMHPLRDLPVKVEAASTDRCLKEQRLDELEAAVAGLVAGQPKTKSEIRDEGACNGRTQDVLELAAKLDEQVSQLADLRARLDGPCGAPLPPPPSCPPPLGSTLSLPPLAPPGHLPMPPRGPPTEAEASSEAPDQEVWVVGWKDWEALSASIDARLNAELGEVSRRIDTLQELLEGRISTDLRKVTHQLPGAIARLDKLSAQYQDCFGKAEANKLSIDMARAGLESLEQRVQAMACRGSGGDRDRDRDRERDYHPPLSARGDYHPPLSARGDYNAPLSARGLQRSHSQADAGPGRMDFSRSTSELQALCERLGLPQNGGNGVQRWGPGDEVAGQSALLQALVAAHGIQAHFAGGAQGLPRPGEVGAYLAAASAAAAAGASVAGNTMAADPSSLAPQPANAAEAGALEVSNASAGLPPVHPGLPPRLLLPGSAFNSR